MVRPKQRPRLSVFVCVFAFLGLLHLELPLPHRWKCSYVNSPLPSPLKPIVKTLAARQGSLPGGGVSLERRQLLAGAGMLFGQLHVEPTGARETPDGPAVVLGGSGFLGRRVVRELRSRGMKVVSVSLNGAPNEWFPGETRPGDADGVAWVQANLLSISDKELSRVVANASVVIDCVGQISGQNQVLRDVNGEVTARAVTAAREMQVPRFVYISVADEVSGVVGPLGIVEGYFTGKSRAEEVVQAGFPDGGYAIVRPSAIYGSGKGKRKTSEITEGDILEAALSLKVNEAYAGLVEAVLSSDAVRSVSRALPGFARVALAPPASVEQVASATVNAALGKVSGIIEDTEGINTAAKAA